MHRVYAGCFPADTGFALQGVAHHPGDSVRHRPGWVLGIELVTLMAGDGLILLYHSFVQSKVEATSAVSRPCRCGLVPNSIHGFELKCEPSRHSTSSDENQ